MVAAGVCCIPAWPGCACDWALSTSQAAICDLCSGSRGTGGSSPGGLRLPRVFYLCTPWLFWQMLNKDPRAPSLWEPPIATPLTQQCLSSLQVLKSVWDRGGSLQHDLCWCTWRSFLVLRKPCEIVASYLCGFFLKWNARWWCQWLIITFCDWEYRFHCKINANVNCSIFM